MHVEEFFVQIEGHLFSAEEAQDEMGLQCTVEEAPYPGGHTLRASLHNRGTIPLDIQRAGWQFRGVESAQERKWRIFLDHGSCGWCGVKRLDALGPAPYLEPVRADETVFHRSSLQTAGWDAVTGEAFLVGFLRQRHGYNWVDVMPAGNGQEIERMEAWQDLGIELSPGAIQDLDPLVWARGDDPYALLEGFGRAVQTHHGRRFDGPPVVGMMTWYGYRTAITEEIVLRNARIVGDLFSGYPQEMCRLMLIDHGWSEDACWGFWEADEERFPHGMDGLAREIEKEGLELGLWYTPFCVTENTPNYDDLQEMLARDEEGDPQIGYGSVWGALPGHPSGRWPVRYFDGTQEKVQEKWHDELARMKTWDTVYWKLDFFSLRKSAGDKTGIGALHERTWTNFRQAVGEEGHLAPCSCGTNIQLGYCDSIRIGSDIGNAGAWPGAIEQYRHGIAPVAGLWYKNRTFWVNDPDSIQIGKGCSLGEARVRATAAALSGGHLMLSEDLASMDGERLEMIRRLLPPCGQAARPLDLFEHPFPEEYPALWALSLDTGMGPVTALAAFNLTETTRTFRIEPDMLGMEEGCEFLALEWWQSRWLGRFDGPFNLEVPPGDVAVIHAGHPQEVPSLISVSHHITGGYIVDEVTFDPDSGLLSGILATKAGLNLVLFGHLPEGWTLSRESRFHGMAGAIGSWQHEVVTTETHTPFAIRFERVSS